MNIEYLSTWKTGLRDVIKVQPMQREFTIRNRSILEHINIKTICMDPLIWGPSAWILIHHIPFTEKITPKEKSEFFRCLGHVLPCSYCRKSYCKFIREHPPPTDQGTHRLMMWTRKLHDMVRTKLSKQGRPPTKSKVPVNRMKSVYGSPTHKLKEENYKGEKLINCILENNRQVHQNAHQIFFSIVERVNT